MSLTSSAAVEDLFELVKLAPFCPAPKRIAHSHWMGHIPFSFWLITNLKPKLFVELGTYTGVSFCAFCQQIEHLHMDCQAYAVDLWEGDANMGTYGAEIFDDLSQYIKDNYASFAYLIRSSFDNALDLFKDKSIDLLHIDGFHSHEAMLHDFQSWLPKMSDSGIILIHDICARIPGYGGVSAWEEISKKYPNFSFLHGYGLGFVAIGINVPQSLKTLAALDIESADSFRKLFYEQAQIYEVLFHLAEKRQADLLAHKVHVDNLATQLNEQHEKLANAEKIYRQELAKQNEEAQKLREYIAEQAKQMEKMAGVYEVQKARLEYNIANLEQGYTNSLSWKLTAPLRKIGKFFRP